MTRNVFRDDFQSISRLDGGQRAAVQRSDKKDVGNSAESTGTESTYVNGQRERERESREEQENE